MKKHDSVLIGSKDLQNVWADDNHPCIADTGLWIVSWPDHVTTARFNGDCHYSPALMTEVSDAVWYAGEHTHRIARAMRIAMGMTC
jgi:hypothetical protein